MFGAHGRRLSVLVLGGLFAALGGNALAGDQDFKDLFNGRDLSGWKTIVQIRDATDKKKVTHKADDGKTFSVKNGVIVVSGSPQGYFYTDKSYRNYVLRFDWKFAKDGNSGLLVHIQPPHEVWPKSVEVQGMQSQHGKIFAIRGAKGEFKTDANAQKSAIRMADWNTTEVTVKNGEISSKINGIPISTGKADVMEGPFGLQSEGSELYFKNIKIKVLDGAVAKAPTKRIEPAKQPATTQQPPVKQVSGATTPKYVPPTAQPAAPGTTTTTTEVTTYTGGGRIGILARIRGRFGR